MNYDEFLKKKAYAVESVGFDVQDSELNQQLFDWQRAIVRWALHRGRAALFEDCGLGKTAQQLEWARHVSIRTGKPVLIVAPLAVAMQTRDEGTKFGIHVTVCKADYDVEPGVNVTNYEKLHHFKPEVFGGIVLDESSILKAFEGATRQQITDFTKSIHYRLACTATPAPNDLIEITNHSEFLDIMKGKEIIALFFKQDGNTTHAWRLKKHAVEPFYRWLAEWAVAIRKPSDIGYNDGGFVLPPLHMNQITTEGKPADGCLFVFEAQTLQERREARKASLPDRVQACANLVNGNDEQWLVWCDLNAESQSLTRAISGAVEVTGSDPPEHKEKSMLDFVAGRIRVLVTKPSIAGFGMNFQHCHNMAFVGLSDSWEQLYQATRRCWRFGQKHPVNAWIITSDAEGAVVKNIERKERQATEMFDQIIENMNVHELNRKAHKDEAAYIEDEASGGGWVLKLGDSVKRIKEIADDTIGLTVFSPPFPNMYAYNNIANDIGNSNDIMQLVKHFTYMIPDILRITMPGRICAIHLQQAMSFKWRDGFTGIIDFRGRVIEAMTEAGWIFHGEVTIDKNPQLQATRNKDQALLFKTLATDSSKNRPAMADYMCFFRKPGDNNFPIKSGVSKKYNQGGGWITEQEWIEWAAPVWYRHVAETNTQQSYPAIRQFTDGIRETDVLNVRVARDENDERHLCPLQLGVIERAVKLWSAPGDTVFSPFAGIGSEGYQAIKFGRKFIGIELKPSYWKTACENLTEAAKIAEGGIKQLNMFDE